VSLSTEPTVGSWLYAGRRSSTFSMGFLESYRR
jgi:hypothetical protein